MRLRLSGRLVLAALALAACSDSSGPTGPDDLYQANLTKWNTTGPRSYQMVLTRNCACPVPEVVLMVVQNRVVTSRTFVETGEPVPPGRAADFPDVPGLFALVKQAMDEEAFSYNAAYDPTYGYPYTVYVDFVGSTLTDNVSYAVTEFASLPQP
ncbi:MAG TPA: DUF6174 domain-containing protein [Gemmatimonadales bacterium]